MSRPYERKGRRVHEMNTKRKRLLMLMLSGDFCYEMRDK